MGSITTGIGLISGIDIASLIDSLITLESGGRTRLTQRVGILQAQQTALLDVNARLLNLKSASRAFRIDDVFRTAIATSSDDEVLTATATTAAQPGSFKFIVRSLVQTSQQLSQGYATRDETPIGLDSISFELGNGRVTTDRALEDLNGGAGVDRGSITITDRTGATATIDLGDVTVMSEVVERINGAATIQVTASVVDDHLVLTDTSGATTSSLIVASAAGDTTAEDLGIAGSVAAATLTGTSILYLAEDTPLASLNDGNGVLIRDNVADLHIVGTNGDVYDVDLGRIDLPITGATLLADLNNGDGVRFDDDTETPDIAFVDREGTLHEVDLSGITTVQGLIDRVSAETGGKITVSITTGDHLTVTSAPGAALLKVLGAGDTATDAAEDLGILNEAGVDAASFEGSIIPAAIDQGAAATIGDVIERINAALGSVSGLANLVASIAPDTQRLLITDSSGGAGALVIETTAGNPRAAIDLGIATTGSASPLSGERIIGSLGTVLLANLNGGSGPSGTTLDITDRAGAQVVLDLSAHETLDEVVDAINAAAVAVTASINDTGTGLVITDTSGSTAGNLVVTGNAAAGLGVAADVAANRIDGTNLQRRYVSEATKLSDLNYGRGIGTGSFRITDGLGDSAVVTIGGDETTLYDVIAEINSRNLAVTARINDTGDGLLIETDLADPNDAFVAIKVEAVSGTTAADLNIAGESADVQGGFIDGSYEIVVDLDVNDTLEEAAEKINDAGANVGASIINTGSGATPFRLNLTSAISGRAGDLVVDTGGVNLGLTTLSRGADAKVFFGADNPADGFLLTSSTNSVEGVIPGVTIDLLAVSDDPVTLTIERDVASIVESMRQLVTTFNDVIGRLNQYDFYDVDTEQRGLLLGDPTIAGVRSSLYRIATGRALNVDGPLQSLAQAGVRFDGEGLMTFDEARFRDAYANDPDAVEALIATYDVTIGGTSEIADGVTVTETETTFNALGFGNLFDRLLDDLTNSVNGVVTRADEAFGSQIELIRDRIETLDARLEARADQLTTQFAAMEASLARLQSQSSALASLATNLTSAQSLLRSR